MKPLVSVVLETYNEDQNGLAQVGEVIDALRGQDYPLEQAELILIGSADEIRNWRTYSPAWPPFGEVRMIEWRAGRPLLESEEPWSGTSPG